MEQELENMTNDLREMSEQDKHKFCILLREDFNLNKEKYNFECGRSIAFVTTYSDITNLNKINFDDSESNTNFTITHFFKSYDDFKTISSQIFVPIE